MEPLVLVIYRVAWFCRWISPPCWGRESRKGAGSFGSAGGRGSGSLVRRVGSPERQVECKGGVIHLRACVGACAGAWGGRVRARGRGFLLWGEV